MKMRLMAQVHQWLGRISPFGSCTLAAKSEPNPRDDELDLSHLPFRPYRVQQNDRGEWVILRENRLQDVIRDVYLKNAVMWLLGYDARYPLQDQISDAPIRSQQAQSPWQVAYNAHTLLQARSILARDHPYLAAEIDRKLESAIPWLLAQRCPQGDGSIHWEQRRYDTGVIASTLLSYLDSQQSIDSRLAGEIKTTVIAALKWLAAEVDGQNKAVDHARPDGMDLLAFTSAWEHLNSAEREIMFAPWGSFNSVLVRSIEDVLLWVRKQRPRRDDETVGSGWDKEEELHAGSRLSLPLANALTIMPDSLQADTVSEIRYELVRSLEYLNSRASEGRFGTSPAHRALRLTAYIAAAEAVGLRSKKEQEIITQTLYQLVSHDTLFEDGSIYHSLYPTTYLAETLVAVHNCWLGQRSLVAIFNDLLRGRDLEVREEREQVFALQRQLIAAERNTSELATEAKALSIQNRRLRRLFLLLLVGVLSFLTALMLVAPALGIGRLILSYNPEQTEALLALIALTAGLAGALVTAIEIIFFRDGHTE